MLPEAVSKKNAPPVCDTVRKRSFRMTKEDKELRKPIRLQRFWLTEFPSPRENRAGPGASPSGSRPGAGWAGTGPGWRRGRPWRCWRPRPWPLPRWSWPPPASGSATPGSWPSAARTRPGRIPGATDPPFFSHFLSCLPASPVGILYYPPGWIPSQGVVTPTPQPDPAKSPSLGVGACICPEPLKCWTVIHGRC